MTPYAPARGELTDAELDEAAEALAPLVSLRATALISEVRMRRDALQRARALMAAWRTGDDPEGPPSSSRTLLAIAEMLEL